MAVNAMGDGDRTSPGRSGAMAFLTPSHAWVAMRMAIGWLFLWTFLDKLLGLGFPTEVGWIDGGSPTFGFMAVASHGLLDELYVKIGGNGLVDLLYMASIGGAGIALVLGIAVRIAALVGAAVHVVIWSTYLPPVDNPFIDEHIFQAIALIGIAIADAGSTWGFGAWWGRMPFVQRMPLLK